MSQASEQAGGRTPEDMRDPVGAQPGEPEYARNDLELTELTRRAALRDCGIVGLCLLLAWLGPRVWYHAQASCPGPLDLLWAWLVPNVLLGTTAVGLALLLTMPRDGLARTLGLRRDGMEGQVLWGIGGGILAYAVFLLWLGGDWSVRYVVWHLGLGEPAWSEAAQDPGRAWDNLSIGTTLTVAVAASVVEEVAFRGLLLLRLRRVTGRWWSAVAICALLFGVWHVSGGFDYVLETAIVSTVFSLVFIRSRSLLAAVMAHSLYNVAHLHVGAWWSTEL